MINVVKQKTGAVSFLHVCEADSFSNSKPTVIFVHGFQSVKENNLHYSTKQALRKSSFLACVQ